MNHEFELIHLSTAMCGRHRTDCLNRIGALLDPGNPKPVICVSTQLIEAGVDISFAGRPFTKELYGTASEFNRI